MKNKNSKCIIIKEEQLQGQQKYNSNQDVLMTCHLQSQANTIIAEKNLGDDRLGGGEEHLRSHRVVKIMWTTQRWLKLPLGPEKGSLKCRISKNQSQGRGASKLELG